MSYVSGNIKVVEESKEERRFPSAFDKIGRKYSMFKSLLCLKTKQKNFEVNTNINIELTIDNNDIES